METTGKISRVTDVKVISDKFKKVEFILLQKRVFNEEISENHIKFQVSNSKIEELKKFNLGDKVKVFFNISGTDRKKNDNSGFECFNNLNVYKIESIKKEKED